MKRTSKQGIALLLAMAMLLALCSCAQIKDIPPEELPESTDGTKLPAEPGKGMVDKETDEAQPDEAPKQPAVSQEEEQEELEEPAWQPAPEASAFSEEGAQSLMWLRERMDFPQTMFGMAYLGYVGGLFEEGFEAGFPAWLRENNEAILLEYPFIAEIDADHIIGGAGHLYCIVPMDENATVAANRVQWNPETYAYDVTEVLYRAETGEPILLFANLDDVAYETDTQVFITDNQGNSCMWEPSMDAMSYLVPCMSEEGETLSFDFTEYGWRGTPIELAPWLADGWSGMTALGLAGAKWGRGWSERSTAWETGDLAEFELWIYPEDETGGTAELLWYYENSSYYQEIWSGFWTIEIELDGPSYVTLDLSLVGGANYETTDGPLYLSETYPMLIDPSGTKLLIGQGLNGICLPFQSEGAIAQVLEEIPQ